MEIFKTEGVFRRTKSGHGYVETVRDGILENVPVAVSYNSDVYDGDTVLLSVSSSQPSKREDKRHNIGKIIKL